MGDYLNTLQRPPQDDPMENQAGMFYIKTDDVENFHEDGKSSTLAVWISF